MLYLVATPIGNYADLSTRALEVLREADVVASEDTRRTARLLGHHGIKQRLVSFHEHNEARMVDKLFEWLQQGQTIAVVSDAGTPGISDPGYSIVRRCIDAGLALTMVPGPVAFVLALVLSGLPAHSFTFRGFAPRKPGKRRRFLELDAGSPHTLVFYESPHRLRAFLEDALAVYGDRAAAVANDLTKTYEAIVRGRLAELLEHPDLQEPRGEFTVVIEGVREP